MRFPMWAVLPLLLLAPASSAPAAGAPDTAERLLRTPVTQMDYGLERMTRRLVPVFEELGAYGVVVWNRSDSRIEIHVDLDPQPEDKAPWDGPRRVAARIRDRLGVDPKWGRLRDVDVCPLAEDFSLVSSPPPPNEALAALVRIRIAVRMNPAMSPTHYVGDLLDDDVRLVGATPDFRSSRPSGP